MAKKHFQETNKIEIMPSWNDYDHTMQCQLIFLQKLSSTLDFLNNIRCNTYHVSECNVTIISVHKYIWSKLFLKCSKMGFWHIVLTWFLEYHLWYMPALWCLEFDKTCISWHKQSRSRSPADVSEANNLNHTDCEVTLRGKRRVLESVATLRSAKSQVGVQENAGASAETRFHQWPFF